MQGIKEKYIYIFTVILAVLVAAFFIWSARRTKTASDQMLEEFKRVDESLGKRHDSLLQSNDSIRQFLQNKMPGQ